MKTIPAPSAAKEGRTTDVDDRYALSSATKQKGWLLVS
jgi:hypothetical protein